MKLKYENYTEKLDLLFCIRYVNPLNWAINAIKIIGKTTLLFDKKCKIDSISNPF